MSGERPSLTPEEWLRVERWLKNANMPENEEMERLWKRAKAELVEDYRQRVARTRPKMPIQTTRKSEEK